MQKPKKPVLRILLITSIILLIILAMQPISVYLFHNKIAILFPSGKIAFEERNLLLIIQALMLLVIIPVYILTFIFSWKYRADNKNGTYDPDLVDHTVAEFIWWGLPILMVMIIGAITWVKTHELDPYKPISSEKKTLKIEVVALQWKWLFIYPEEKIATVNFLQIPEKTAIHFQITSDAPMNSFWIPDLGGQIYAMPGMTTELNLIADTTGEFRGSSANISGKGFSGMHFVTQATDDKTFQNWVEAVKLSTKHLDFQEYQKLAAPDENHPKEVYRLQDENLFSKIIKKYNEP